MSSLPPRDAEMDALREVFADMGFQMEPKRVLLERDEAEIRRQRREYWRWDDDKDPLDEWIEAELDSEDLEEEYLSHLVRAYLAVEDDVEAKLDAYFEAIFGEIDGKEGD